MYLRKLVLAAAIASLGVSSIPAPVFAHGGSHEKKAAAKSAHVSVEEHAFGRAGDPKKVNRTIDVGMDNSMHFTPGDIVVKRGETIRFTVHNDGQIMHEMVIGTMKELKDHAELMRKFPNMEHDEPYMAHVAPGKREELVWQFTKAGEFYYACLIPGHFEAGMIAKITVK
jgi:uncharacterized cupredoxin-like copper-binding protein